MLIIGISGGTGSGKTTVVRNIVQHLGRDRVAVLSLDSYYKDSSHIPAEKRQLINFDHPNAFDWDLLLSHVGQLRDGRGIEQPVYDYITSSRQPETTHVEPREVVIIEGILIFFNEQLRRMMDLKIFVDIDNDDRLIRIIERDVASRGRTAQAVIDRYISVLKPMHQQFVEPYKQHANLIVPQGGENHVAIHILTTYIDRYLSKSHTP